VIPALALRDPMAFAGFANYVTSKRSWQVAEQEVSIPVGPDYVIIAIIYRTYFYQ
jgi:hypothetical protein